MGHGHSWANFPDIQPHNPTCPIAHIWFRAHLQEDSLKKWGFEHQNLRLSYKKWCRAPLDANSWVCFLFLKLSKERRIKNKKKRRCKFLKCYDTCLLHYPQLYPSALPSPLLSSQNYITFFYFCSESDSDRIAWYNLETSALPSY